MKQTNLEKIKEVAKWMFTAVPIEPDERFKFMIQHPFASNTLVGVSNKVNLSYYIGAINKILITGRNGYTNISPTDIKYLEDLKNGFLKNNVVDITIPEGAEVFKQHTFNLIDDAKSIDEILMLINKPWYMTFIKYTEEFMSPEDLGKTLGDCWVMQEYPNRDCNASIYDIIEWFKKADKKSIMTELDYNQYIKILNKGTLTVYRGISHNGKPGGLSWTTDYEKAKWFANRFKSDTHKVYKLTIDILKHRDVVLAYFSSRDEQEIVVDTHKVNNWEVIEDE